MNEVILNSKVAQLGALLRVARERTGRNQAEVAGAAKISPSMLSQIERGSVAPSIETLLQVCAALDLDAAELFRRLSPEKPVRVVGRSNRLRSSPHRGIRFEQLVASANPAHAAEMFLLEIEAGRQAGVSGRGHEGVELGSVLAGQGLLTVDSVEYRLDEGDSVSFNSALPHRLENRGPGVFRSVWVVLPPHRDFLDIADKEGGKS